MTGKQWDVGESISDKGNSRKIAKEDNGWNVGIILVTAAPSDSGVAGQVQKGMLRQ